MATTSTVVPGGDLAGRSAEYRRGYVRGVMTAWPFHVFVGGIVVLAVSAVGAIGTTMSRANRAEAQLAEMRARGFTVVAPPSARDGDVVMLRWDNGGWRPMSARLPLAGGTLTGQSLHFGVNAPSPVSTTPHVVDWFSHTEYDVAVGSTIVEVR